MIVFIDISGHPVGPDFFNGQAAQNCIKIPKDHRFLYKAVKARSRDFLYLKGKRNGVLSGFFATSKMK